MGDKVFKNGPVPGWDDEPIMKPQSQEDMVAKKEPEPASLFNIIWMIVNNAPVKTQQDSINAGRLGLSLRECGADGGEIRMDDDVHDWFKPIAKEVTPALFRLSGNQVYKHICEGFEKKPQPADRRVEIETKSEE